MQRRVGLQTSGPGRSARSLAPAKPGLQPARPGHSPWSWWSPPPSPPSACPPRRCSPGAWRWPGRCFHSATGRRRGRGSGAGPRSSASPLPRCQVRLRGPRSGQALAWSIASESAFAAPETREPSPGPHSNPASMQLRAARILHGLLLTLRGLLLRNAPAQDLGEDASGKEE